MSYDAKTSTPRKPFGAVGSLSAADLYAAAGLFAKMPASVRVLLSDALTGWSYPTAVWRLESTCASDHDAACPRCIAMTAHNATRDALLDALNGGA